MDKEHLYNPLISTLFHRLLPVCFIIFLILAGTGIYFYKHPTQKNSVMCTADAKQCSDGSYVSRTGSHCEFANCPAAKPSAPTPTQRMEVPTVLPTPTTSFSASCCSKAELKEGYNCVQDCGPIQVRQTDKKTYSCLTKQQSASRERFHCPICLADSTMISTPTGKVNIKDIQTGDYVWTVNEKGKKVSAAVLQTYFAKVPANHKIVHLVLSDKREVWISPFHPLATKNTIEKLRVGNYYDNAKVLKADLIMYGHDTTYDLLPKSATGYYWANDILMGSTLKK